MQSALAQIDTIAPKFAVDGSDISVIQTPADFYELLKQKIKAAKSRIFLATLYIGKSENELIQCLEDALTANPNLEVYILADALRGTREAPEKCSASLLVPLLKTFGPRVQVALYHTPHLNGVKKALIPQRFNEGWGLQHMKLYGFDDEIILSGANLSMDYFTNRQDRYILFKSKPLTDYYFRIHEAVSSLSYHVVPTAETKSGFKLRWPHVYTSPEPTESPVEYIKAATKKLKALLGPQNSPEPRPDASPYSPLTYVYPISQFTPLLNPDTSTEFVVVSRILSMLGADRFNWTLTAGYFNIHPEYRDKLLKTRPQTAAQVITAAPEANGFYKSKGPSGLLPQVYSELAKRFLQDVTHADVAHRITVSEWKNGVVNTPGGWSYHAKGLWVTEPSDESVCMTVIGSSNYTRRAYSHDLEANALIVTKDPVLKAQLTQEVAHLRTHTTTMKLEDFDREDRKPDWRQKAFIRTMGDKL
ncbi:CDP-diacylglycerol--glycerol-3-phosphate 3-phosphatidyltransferase [Trichomonascus vanleenenianus]|uniref:CDP-diacylglycerol--glycerol-3-phosphate 3-phosphatidyltransferase n=1 Tax=Trichomonascus vanleenenianus TaxID=2268995 RepID=UPI003ECA4567